MFLFTQIGVTSSPVEQAIVYHNALAPVVAEASTTSTSTESAITVLPKKKISASQTQVDTYSPLVAAEVKEYFANTPILASIARCESGNRQFDASGNVLRGRVNSSDVGVMQINERYHAARAKALGYDLHTLEGNLGYAAKLYKEQGTRPWISSSPCWGAVVASNS